MRVEGRQNAFWVAMDYNDVITAHEKSGASITMVYRKAKDADAAWVGDASDPLRKGGGSG